MAVKKKAATKKKPSAKKQTTVKKKASPKSSSVVVKKSSKKKASSAAKAKPITAPEVDTNEVVVPFFSPDDETLTYPVVNIHPYFDRKYNPKAYGSLTFDTAQELLGWKEEQPEINVKFGNDFLFRDRHGKKVRCINNLHNRPFNKGLAEKWMLEVLRRKWRLNGETMIIDCRAMTQDAQHRLAGFCWAVQEWRKVTSKWRKYWKTEPVMDTIIVTGIPDDDETIDTINTGKPRTLSDVIFRSVYFQDIVNVPHRVKVARIAEWCMKLIWRRTGQKHLSNAPGMPHSEALDFIDRHPKVLEAIRHVWESDGSNSLINGYIKLGQAAGIMYMMGVGATKRDAYTKVKSEKGIDFKYWDKALDFWTRVANKSANEQKLEDLREKLLNIPEDATGPFVFALKSSLLAKSWDLFSKGKPVKGDLIEIAQGRDEEGRPCIAEPLTLFGGIDIGDETEEEDDDNDEE